MKQNKPKTMTHIGNILDASLKSCRTGGDGDMVRIWNIWDSAVGDVVARNCRPSAFKGQHLVVKVSSSAWLHHLNFLKKDLIRNINDGLGSDMVRDISFKIGETGN
jgi:predicted nucleic acid-binding Zn ribbon protein